VARRVFDFCLGRGRDGPKRFLDTWEGILQTDGYAAYDDVGGPKLVHVGCWAHARRKFVDAVKVNPKDGAAIAMVTRMDALFLVDRHSRQQQLNAEGRAALRRDHFLPARQSDSIPATFLKLFPCEFREVVENLSTLMFRGLPPTRAKDS
jgi:hypothetical protein